MGITVGAALKKLALVLLRSKDTAKKLGTAVLVILLTLLLLVIAIASVTERLSDCWRRKGACPLWESRYGPSER